MAKKERLIQGEKVQRRVRAFVRCLDLPTVAAAQPRCPATLEWVLFLLTIVAPVNNSVVKYGAEFAASCLGGAADGSWIHPGWTKNGMRHLARTVEQMGCSNSLSVDEC
jgi:hypothetical protein